jgi:hypothetical protein
MEHPRGKRHRLRSEPNLLASTSQLSNRYLNPPYAYSPPFVYTRDRLTYVNDLLPSPSSDEHARKLVFELTSRKLDSRCDDELIRIE